MCTHIYLNTYILRYINTHIYQAHKVITYLYHLMVGGVNATYIFYILFIQNCNKFVKWFTYGRLEKNYVDDLACRFLSFYYLSFSYPFLRLLTENNTKPGSLIPYSLPCKSWIAIKLTDNNISM